MLHPEMKIDCCWDIRWFKQGLILLANNLVNIFVIYIVQRISHVRKIIKVSFGPFLM